MRSTPRGAGKRAFKTTQTRPPIVWASGSIDDGVFYPCGALGARRYPRVDRPARSRCPSSASIQLSLYPRWATLAHRHAWPESDPSRRVPSRVSPLRTTLTIAHPPFLPVNPATPSTQVVAKVTPKEARRQKRHTKIRSKVSGTADRPRISVYRSNQHTYVQVIDDENQTTLCAVGTMSPKIKEIVGSEEWKSKTVDAAREVGKAVGAMCVEKGIKTAVFDRGDDVESSFHVAEQKETRNRHDHKIDQDTGQSERCLHRRAEVGIPLPSHEEQQGERDFAVHDCRDARVASTLVRLGGEVEKLEREGEQHANHKLARRAEEHREADHGASSDRVDNLPIIAGSRVGARQESVTPVTQEGDRVKEVDADGVDHDAADRCEGGGVGASSDPNGARDVARARAHPTDG